MEPTADTIEALCLSDALQILERSPFLSAELQRALQVVASCCH